MRARNLKPGFFKNAELADLGPICQLLFEGLWCMADRAGRLDDKPRLIKAELFPYYDVDVNGELTKLERWGFIRRYEADGGSYIEVKNFLKHQSPHSTEKKSVIPGPDSECGTKPATTRVSSDNGALTVDPPKHLRGNRPDSLIHRFTDSLIPDSLIPDSLIPDSPTPDVADKSAQPDRSDRSDVLEVFEHWKTTMGSPGAVLTEERVKLIRKSLRAGYTVDALRQAITGCSLTPHNMGANDRGQKYNGLNVILRSGDQIDRFRANCASPPRPMNAHDRNVEYARQSIDDFVGGGQHD